MGELKSEGVQKPTSFFGVRHVQFALLFVGTLVAYAVRIAFSVGIIAMISSEPPKGVPTYPEWTKKKNIMLSSFFWGYTIPQVIAGELIKRYGAKWFLGITTFVGCLFSLLIPFFGSTFGAGGVIFCRVIQGLTQSFLFPCVHTLLSKWSPVAERAKMGSFTYAGIPLGTLISMPVTGFLSKYENIGWPASYYLFGALGMIWSLAWMALGSDSPSKHSSISKVEKEYIEYGSSSGKDHKKLPTPWTSILKSLPFWAVVVCFCGEGWGFWTLLTQIPSYLQKILDFDIASNSVISALPYFALWIVGYVMGPTADYLVQKNITSRTANRKIFTSIAMFVPVVALFSLTLVGKEQKVLTIFLLVVAVGAAAGMVAGSSVNLIDLSPNHVGALMACTLMISNMFSLAAPLSVDVLSHITGYQETDRELWKLVFYAASAVYLAAGVFYVYAASAEVQPWNDLSEKDEVNKNGYEEVPTEEK